MRLLCVLCTTRSSKICTAALSPTAGWRYCLQDWTRLTSNSSSRRVSEQLQKGGAEKIVGWCCLNQRKEKTMPVARVHCNRCSSDTDRQIGRVKTMHGRVCREGKAIMCSRRKVGVCNKDCSGSIVLAAGTPVTKNGTDRIIRIM